MDAHATDKRRYFGRGDNLAVRTEELAAEVRKWIEKHDADHPHDYGTGIARNKQGRQHVRGFSGAQYIVFHSGRSPKALSRLLREESEYTSLDIADAILSAIGLMYLLVDGTLWVGKDPRVGQRTPWVGTSRTRGVVEPAGGQNYPGGVAASEGG